MLDLIFLVLFIALPIAIWLISRSLTLLAVGLAFGFGLAGNAVQTAIALGMDWSVRGLQWFAVVVMTVVLLIAVRHRSPARSLRRQFLIVVVPALFIGLFLVAMRLLAPGSPEPLTAVGYLINHPLAEDNAKWLHLTAQLADGRFIEFNGYAGGPLLLVMAMMAALVSVLSTIVFGGVNEVAVATNTVVGTQFLLITLVPFVFAPFAERRIRTAQLPRLRLPAPAVLIAVFTVFLASAVVTSYGHLSLQYVLLILVLWASVFITPVPGRARLLMTLTIATTASVWLPLNVLGLSLLAVSIMWVIRRRDWVGLGLTVLTIVLTWNALISSVLFLLGFASDDGSVSVEESIVSSGPLVDVAQSLFSAPGGVEQIAPLVGALALASVLFALWYIAGGSAFGWRPLMPFAPIVILAGYVVLILMADAVKTGSAPNYGSHKLLFALVIMALAATLPIAVASLGPSQPGMTTVRWMAVGGIVILLSVDTLLPRALSALSPVLWPNVDAAAPRYWAAAEVKPTANQPIASLPIACVVAPPESPQPTGLPLGQEAYSCTRLLLGMSGLEGGAPVLVNWLQTDWLSNTSTWDTYRASIIEGTQTLNDRSVIVMKSDGTVAGLTTLGTLIERNPASSG